ncbi:hypothetical protein [Paenibacillus yanchengensis]|uniref:Histidine kinase n=1 Tax=Paenibacillus yanchengensis TaxID=2035833 RepID=A0ABW4YPA3_9BACL
MATSTFAAPIIILMLIGIFILYDITKHKTQLNPILIAILGIEITIIGGFILLSARSESTQIISALIIVLGFIIVAISALRKK